MFTQNSYSLNSSRWTKQESCFRRWVSKQRDKKVPPKNFWSIWSFDKYRHCLLTFTVTKVGECQSKEIRKPEKVFETKGGYPHTGCIYKGQRFLTTSSFLGNYSQEYGLFEYYIDGSSYFQACFIVINIAVILLWELGDFGQH